MAADKVIDKLLTLDCHTTAIYYTEKENPSATGALYMYDKIDESTVILGIFHYKSNIYAAKTAKETFVNTYKSRTFATPKTADNWKQFLIETMEKIESALMAPELDKDLKDTLTRAVVAVVGKDFVTHANIGDSRILFYNIKSGQKAATEDHSRSNRNEWERMAGKTVSDTCNFTRMLGGYYEKKEANSGMIGQAAFGIQKDVTFLIMGTNDFFGKNVNNDRAIEVMKKNIKDPKTAAKALVKEAKLDKDKKDGELGIFVTKFTSSTEAKKKKTGRGGCLCFGR